MQKIREAKQALEDEAREKAEQKLAEAEKEQAEEEEDRCAGKKNVAASPIHRIRTRQNPQTSQRNFTDPESRIMPDGANKGRFLQAYNAQIAVDSIAQVIVAAEVRQETKDKKQLLPMVAQIEKNPAQKTEKVSADSGYFSEANVTDATVAEIDLYIATGRDKHGDATEISSGEAPAGATAQERMRHKLKTEAGRAVCKRRKAIVEPVFGQIKECRGFRRFSMRGKQNARGEWKLVCAVSNLLKLFRSRWALQTA